MDIYADKTILIAGAATDIVWRLLPRLEKAEARLILLDQDEDELLSMARKSPSAIEPLPIASLTEDTIKQVGAIWGDEPIDILLDFFALSERQDGSRKLGLSSALMEAFEPALMTADGCVVSVAPKTTAEDPASIQMAEAACLKLADVMVQKWARWRVTYNLLRPETGASATALTNAVEIAVRAGWDNFTGVHIPIRSAAH